MAAAKGNKYAIGNKGGGRPSVYKDEYVEWGEKMAKLGATDVELADAFGISVETLNAWKREKEEFFCALKRGKLLADAEVADKLYKKATGYSHEAVKIFANPTTGAEQIVPYIEHYPPDTAACIFWLKNRQRDKWRDKIDQEITGKDGSPLTMLLQQVSGSALPVINDVEGEFTEVKEESPAPAKKNRKLLDRD